MALSRRRFLLAGAALATGAVRAQATAQGRRAVIVGGGWGGLSAARHLRALVPELEVVLVERHERFFSLPLSNKWLAGLADGRALVHDYGAAARAYGYRFVQGEVTAIDRQRRRIVSRGGAVDYDWLVLAPGIRHDYAAWFGENREAAAHARQQFPCAFTADEELAALKRKLDAFPGGELLMTVPPMPYRCPPAPYERAAMIAQLLKARKLKARLTLVDPNEPVLGFQRLFRDEYRSQVTYLPHARIRAVDPFKRTVATDFEELRFDEAILMPPQQAGELAWQAGAVDPAAGWAAVDPLHLHLRTDERVFVTGDAVGRVSPLFGQYPKTGQMAAHMGRIVAQEIAARARGRVPEPTLPESTCFVVTRVEPEELTRVDARYRLRGDGEIAQEVKQARDPNPRGEDVAWAKGMYAEVLAFRQ
jgi:NADPH-dependent 2,4-dienoyl-CoA reductase/sulfur reductase-like enzyme